MVAVEKTMGTHVEICFDVKDMVVFEETLADRKANELPRYRLLLCLCSFHLEEEKRRVRSISSPRIRKVVKRLLPPPPETNNYSIFCCPLYTTRYIQGGVAAVHAEGPVHRARRRNAASHAQGRK